MKKLITVLTAALMLTACAKAPENVKNKKHYENSEITAPREMIPPNALHSTSEKALEAQHKQFVIDNKKLVLPSRISRLGFTQINGFENNYESVFDSMLGKELWHSEKTVRQTASKENGGMTSYTFSNENKKIYGCVGDNGFITFIKPECFDDPYAVAAETVRVYDICKDRTSGDRYRLADGEYSISEAVSFTEKWLKENYARYEPYYELRVKTVTVKKSGVNYCFAVSVQNLFEGVPLDDIMIMHGGSEPKVKNSVSKLSLTIHKRADISSFTNGAGIVKPTVTEQVKELLSLQSVMDICQDKFSAYNEIRIKSIGLKYTVEPVYSENDKYNGAYYDAGRKFTSHILWELVVGQSETDPQRRKIKYIYVDAQTGEIDFDFDGVTVA